MLQLLGLGHFHPENVIDNAFLESLDIGTNEEWIMKRVGIETRRTVMSLDYLRETRNKDIRASIEASAYTNAETGSRASRMAIERAGLKPDDIGMVISGSCAPSTCIPSEGSAIACELGIEVPAFDLHSACSTFGAQLHFVSQLGDSAPDYVLCAQIENVTRVIDFSDRSSAVLFGDATAAAVVSNKHEGRAEVLYSEFGGAPSGAWDVVIPRAGFFSQNGAKVQKFAIKKMSALYQASQQLVDEERREQVVYVGHQANLAMLKSVAKRCNVPEDRHWFNIHRFGNVGAAGAPTVLSQHWDSVQQGELVSCVVVGSGLSWSSLLFRF